MSMITSEEKPPRVSVIVRTRDRPDFLRQALESLAQQTFQDFETVLVDDGEVAAETELNGLAPGRRVTLVRPGPPHGRSRALNHGLAVAQGEFLSYLDDDDLYLPAHLEKLVLFLESHPGVRGVYSDAALVRQRRLPSGAYEDAEPVPIFGFDFNRNALLFENFVPLLSLLHEKSLVVESGGADESFDMFEDWEFLVRLSRGAPLLHLRETTALYRLRDDLTNATTMTPWLSPEAESARLRVLERSFEEISPGVIRDYLNVLEHRREERERSFATHVRDLEESLEKERAERAVLGEELERKRRDVQFLSGEIAKEKSEKARLREEMEEAGRALGECRQELAVTTSRLSSLERVVFEMTNSIVWRLFTPYWRFKAYLEKRERRVKVQDEA